MGWLYGLLVLLAFIALVLVFTAAANAYLERPQQKRDTVRRPKAAPELTHPVWGISATIADGRCWDGYSVFTVDVPVDEAADLSSPVWGGPLVLLAPHGPARCALGTGRAYAYTAGWTIWIRAFIPEEAMTAIHDLEDLLPASDIRMIPTPTRWRLRDGELIPLEPGEWPRWGLGAAA